MHARLTLLLVLLGANLSAREILPVKVQLEKPSTENGRKHWTTPNFRIDADAGIDAQAVAKLAVISESTAAVLRAHPLPLSAPPEGYKPRISLYSDARAYENAGAAEGSAGYYIGRGEARVLIRADYFLSAVVVERSLRAPDMDEDLAVHELVHLCMHRKLIGLPQWLVDGLAEYFGAAHLGGGRFDFDRMDEALRDHLRVKLSPRDPAIRLLPVATIATLDHRGWSALMQSLPAEERYLAYGTALLLTHYHLHGGAERRERVRAALEKAPQLRKPEAFPTLAEIPAIEAALIRYWRGKGLDLRFAAAAR
jgi:hypothetical protein